MPSVSERSGIASEVDLRARRLNQAAGCLGTVGLVSFAGVVIVIVMVVSALKSCSDIKIDSAGNGTFAPAEVSGREWCTVPAIASARPLLRMANEAIAGGRRFPTSDAEGFVAVRMFAAAPRQIRADVELLGTALVPGGRPAPTRSKVPPAEASGVRNAAARLDVYCASAAR